jgi:hypothetical protein
MNAMFIRYFFQWKPLEGNNKPGNTRVIIHVKSLEESNDWEVPFGHIVFFMCEKSYPRTIINIHVCVDIRVNKQLEQ